MSSNTDPSNSSSARVSPTQQIDSTTLLNSAFNLNCSRRTLEAECLIEMSKMSKTDLQTIADKHKLLANTLVKVSRPLDANNWETWRVEFEILMRNVRLDSIVLKEWDDDSKKEPLFEHFNQLARDNIVFNVSAYLCNFLKYDTSARESYLKLIDHFEGSKIIRGWRLCKSLVVMLTEKNSKLDEVTFRYQSLVDQFNNLFPNVPEEFYVSLFCCVLPDQYDYLLSDILSKPDSQTLRYADIVKLTMGAFARIREKNEGNQEKLYSNVASIQKSNTEKRPDRKKQSQESRQQSDRKSNRNARRSDLNCEYCKDCGRSSSSHSTDKCWRLLQDIMSGKADKNKYGLQASSSGANTPNEQKTNSNADDQKKIAIDIKAFVTNFSDDDELDPLGVYLDCGAAACVFNNPTGATELIKQAAVVKDWENRESTVQGVGTFKYETECNIVLTFNDSLYKSTGAGSFISYSKLAKTKQFYMQGDDETIRFYLKASDQLAFTATLIQSGLYRLNWQPVQRTVRANAIQINQNVPVELKLRYWHRVLEHADFGKLIKMRNLLKITGRPKKRLVCDICTETKATGTPFPISDSIASTIFELLHTDLSGIIRIWNPEGFSYFLVFMDDHSRYIFVFLIARKFQVKHCFARLAKWVSVQFGLNIKNLRSDNGTEFVNAQMDLLVGGQGMNHQKTAHGNPQQDGRSERLIRSIDDAARALLKEASLHVRFWPYAILFAVMIKNLLPHSSINNDIPYFRLFGSYPKYRDLHPFGLKVYALVLNPATKFSDRAVEAIFLGYPQYVKGYYVYLIEADRVDVTRDIYMSEAAAGAAVKLIRASEDAVRSADFVFAEEHQQYLTNALSQPENESSADHYLEQQQYGEDELDFESCVSEFNETLLSGAEQDLNGTPPSITTEQIQDSQANAESNLIQTPRDEPSELYQTVQSAETRLFRDVYSRDSNPSTYEKGDFIMNRSEFAWFTERFPSADIRRLAPYAGGPKNQKQNIYRVNAIQAPRSYKEASSGPNSSLWRSEMTKEYAAQVANGTWKLVERPPNVKVFPMIWVYKQVFDSQGMQIGGKARLVVLGNQQKVDLDEHNYAPVASFVAIRVILALATMSGFFVHHIDCCTAFLNAEVEGDIYAYQPDGFKIKGYERHVLKLQKAQYGLRQSARRWYLYLRAVLLKMNFRQLFTDSCLYIKRVNGVLLIIAVYVDDVLVISSDESAIEAFKMDFGKQIRIRDYGAATKFLGLELKYDRMAKRMEISQEEYINAILKEADFESCNPGKVPMTEADFKQLGEHRKSPERAVDVEFYQKFVGKIIYLVSMCRPDLAYVAGVLCARMHDPGEFHVKLLHNALRYLKGTSRKRLIYLNNSSSLEVYADASFEEDVSKVGMISFLGGNAVSWLSRKQQRVATSTCESEILAVLDSVNEVEYLRNLLVELGFEEIVRNPTTIFNDNMSARHSLETGGDMAKNKHYRNRTNRIVRAIDDKLIQVRYIKTELMLADMFTKPLQRLKLNEHLPRIGFE